MNFTGADITLHRNTQTSSDKQQQLEYLATLTRSYNTVVIVIIAVSLNLYYVYGIRLQLIDSIYGTNFSKNIIKPERAQSLANYLFIYCTAVFLQINVQEYTKIISQQTTTDQLDIQNSYKGVITAILAFTASIISRTVINSQNDTDID